MLRSVSIFVHKILLCLVIYLEVQEYVLLHVIHQQLDYLEMFRPTDHAYPDVLLPQLLHSDKYLPVYALINVRLIINMVIRFIQLVVVLQLVLKVHKHIHML